MAQATIYATATGALLRFLWSDEQHAEHPDPPPGTAQTVTFDTETNPAVVAGINTDWNSHRVVGGVLERNGQPVTLAPEGEATADAREMGLVIDAIRTYLAASGNQRTDAQRMAFERNVGRVLRHLVKRMP
jgi:hypothetical protein